MGAWDNYTVRADVAGHTIRDAVKRREVMAINNKLPNNLSYCDVTIDGIDQIVSIDETDNLNEKIIRSMPGEPLRHGGLVYWMDNYWLITEKSYNTTLYTRAKMEQCNYLLKWVTGTVEEPVIHEQWCIVEDGTKYLTGELEDRNFIVTRGDSRIAVTIAKNADTAALNRESRFLIDDPLSTRKLSYLLTKPLKLGMSFGDDGVYKFVLQEVTATGDDNFDLMIANYYKYFPVEDTSDIKGYTGMGKEVWL